MRIIVLSDTHGYINNVVDKMMTMDKPDLIIHLGDNARDGEKVSEELGIESILVKGNCDLGSIFNEDELIEIRGKKIFLTHGHRYDVNGGLNSIYYKGLEIGADIILFGHTHIPINIKEDNLIIMNPGSPTNPRKSDKIPTFGLIDIKENIITSIIEI